MSAPVPMKDDPKKEDPKKDDKKDLKGSVSLTFPTILTRLPQSLFLNRLDDDKDSGKPLKLASKDKKEFTVERKHAFISTLVKTSLENGQSPHPPPAPDHYQHCYA